MNRTLLTLIAVAATALTSTAHAADPHRMSKPPKAERACFYARSVTNFRAADDRNLYIRVGARDIYHLKMFGNCFDLSWKNALALSSKGGNFICEGDNVSVDVVTRDSAFSNQSCPVSSVRKLTPQDVASLPKKARP